MGDWPFRYWIQTTDRQQQTDDNWTYRTGLGRPITIVPFLDDNLGKDNSDDNVDD